ncbi:MAG: S1 RNA-binding domain-containing protein [Methanobrevibacter sp.]|nr:S1 RNA-binding domain-containing protein [Methanobrevibacter sp.]
MVEVRITEFNEAKGRIVASARQVLEEMKNKKLADFWNDIEVGKRLKGIVKKIADYGVFVEVGPIDGLVHISQLVENKFVKHPLDIVSVGEIVDVKVLDVDLVRNRIQLSMII